MREYKCLNKNEFVFDKFKLVPIRDEDKDLIMQWRNEQIYHLRQNEVLTKEKQAWYFDNIVNKLFDIENPDQLLFSFMEKDSCIGYGGLVHINWEDKNAEISFIINTKLEREYFKLNWKIFLRLIEKVAFSELKLHKIFTYAFDLRQHLYPVLEDSGYSKECVLKEHFFYKGTFRDIIIHSKFSANYFIDNTGNN